MDAMFWLPPKRLLYARGKLGGNQLAAYDAIARGFALGETSVGLPCGLGENEVGRVIHHAIADLPLLRARLGQSYTLVFDGQGTRLELDPAGPVGRAEFARADVAAQAILRNVPAGAGEYEHLRAVYATLTSKVAYGTFEEDRRASGSPAPRLCSPAPRMAAPADAVGFSPAVPEEYAFNLLGPLLYKRGVCQGFSTAMQYLLQRLGMTAVCVGGEARSTSDGNGPDGPHAWLVVRVDGEFWHCDPTWAASSFGGVDEWGTGGLGDVNFDYLGMTDAEVLPTRTPNGNVELPACASGRCGWYRREGLMLSGFDEGLLRRAMTKQLRAGRGVLSARSCDDESFAQLWDYVRDGGALGALLAEAFAEAGLRDPGPIRVACSFDPLVRSVHIRLPREVARLLRPGWGAPRRQN